MRRFDLVVWDWDGTIIDSVGAVSDAMIGAAADLGLPVPTEAQARWVIGMGLLEAVHYAVPAIRREQMPAFIERYRVHYLKRERPRAARTRGRPNPTRGCCAIWEKPCRSIRAAW
ncbi:MAG: hypothetical protein NTV17_08200 [Burkholderiales bacterium]|nr:hypothetical protein [Burkholderiales bacterium]